MKSGAYDAKGKRKYLNRGENMRFLEVLSALPDRDELYFLVLYYTGCRVSEALALRRQDFESDTGVVIFTSLKKRRQIERRRVPVPNELITRITDYFPESENEPVWDFSRTTAWRRMKYIMARAQICGIHATCKGLRHGFGVRCSAKQIPITQISTWMGHSNVESTAIYLDVRDEEERALITRTW